MKIKERCCGRRQLGFSYVNKRFQILDDGYYWHLSLRFSVNVLATSNIYILATQDMLECGNNVEIPPVKTIRYGKNSITSHSVTDWNTINSQININPKECSRGQFYSSVNNYLLSKYTSNF